MTDQYIPNNELRPCAECNGPLGPCFFVVDTSIAVVDPERASMHLGLVAIYGGQPGAEAIANAMGSGACYRIDSETKTRKFVCPRCHR